MIHCQRGRAWFVVCKGAQGDLNSLSKIPHRCSSVVRIFLKSISDFHDQMILVHLRKYGRDLALAKCVVEHVVDRPGGNPQAIRGIAVDDQVCFQTFELLIGRNISQFR